MTNQQFQRVAQLVVANTSIGKARDLSQMHFIFSVKQADNETPNTLVVRIYNLAPNTEAEVLSLYDQVGLQVGYKGTSLDVLFTGQIKSFRRGKESNTDRFLEISAADTDLGYNFGFVSTTLAGGASQADVLRKSAEAMESKIDPNALDYVGTGGILPRGKVLFGLARAHVRTAAETAGCRWSIDNGTITFVQNSGYLPGEAVLITPQTGLIGAPESTPDGINVRCLCNPRIKVGQSVQLEENDIVQYSVPQAQRDALGAGTPTNAVNFPTYTGLILPATVLKGLGTYRVIVAEHQGDNRGQDWYSDLVCLAIDLTSPPGDSVSLSG